MALDYNELGLKAGIEIHQQLNTQHKLFCSCPTTVRDDKADVVIKRKLRASAGETGELDVAAAYEQLRGKYFVYQAYNDTVCDVELDEEPVHQLNREALQIAFQVAMLLKAKLVDRIHVMRKTVVDGSNTSGFQRTALAARNGKVKLGSGVKISIPTVCVEEESAKIVERKADCDTYNLSRLGIPLVEIATGPDMKTPEQVKEAAEYIGMVLRSTGKVKRGLGTIRQDVNVSIAEGARVEIKGAQELRMIPKLVEYEALRQKGLVEVAKELRRNNAVVDAKVFDVTKILGSCGSEIINSVVAKNGVVLAAKLNGFKGLIGKDFAGVPGRRLGRELSEYAKAYAGLGGIFHSDELPRYGIMQAGVDNVSKHLSCSSNDAFVLVAAENEKAEKGINAVVWRAGQAIKGVPAEVRKANDDGTTTFLRPMPGSARMYPETDVPLVNPLLLIKGIKVPRLLAEKAADYQEFGLSADLAKAVLYSDYAELFEELAGKCRNISAPYIADFLVSYEKALIAAGLAEVVRWVSDERLKDVIAAIDSGELAKESAINALADAARMGKLDLSKYAVMPEADLEKELRAVMAANKGMPFNALIGKAMEGLRGKASGQKIVEKLKLLMSQA